MTDPYGSPLGATSAEPLQRSALVPGEPPAEQPQAPRSAWQRLSSQRLTRIGLSRIRLSRIKLSRSLPWQGAVSLLLLALAWQAAAAFFPPYLVPGLGEISKAFLRIVTDPQLLLQALITWSRLVIATLVSVALGTAIGLAMGLYRGADDFIRPVVKFIMGVPALNWVIIVIIWFSSVETRIAVVLVLIGTPLAVFSVYDGVRTIDAKLADMVRAFHASPAQLVRLLYWPYVISFVFTALKLNIGNAVRIVIVAELVGAPSGIGKELDLAKNVFDMPLVMAWTLWMVFTLLVMQKGIEWLENRALHWRVEPGRGGGR